MDVNLRGYFEQANDNEQSIKIEEKFQCEMLTAIKDEPLLEQQNQNLGITGGDVENKNTTALIHIKSEEVDIEFKPDACYLETHKTELSENKIVMDLETEEKFCGNDSIHNSKEWFFDSEKWALVSKANCDIDETNSTLSSECPEFKQVDIKCEPIEADRLSTVENGKTWSDDSGRSSSREVKSNRLHVDLRPRRRKLVANSSKTQSTSETDINKSMPPKRSSRRKENYRCAKSTCRFTTEHEACLKIHMMVHKRLDKWRKSWKHKCSVCNFTARNKETLSTHNLRHLDPAEWQRHKCDACNYTTYDVDLLRRHNRVHKNVLESHVYKCELCDFKTKTKYSMKRHTLIHEHSSKI